MGVADVLEGEGIELRLNATCMSVDEARRRRRGERRLHRRRAAGRSARTCCSRSDGGRTPTISASTRPASRPTRAATSRWTTSCAPMWPGIFALGDCNGRGAFTHTAYNDFEIVAANLLDGEQRRVTDRLTAYALYTDPPLGRCGMTEAEVRKSGRPALIATMPMEDVSRAFEKGETNGFMKILVDKETKQFLGAVALRAERRRDRPHGARPDVRQGAVHRDGARDAYPSDRDRAAADHAAGVAGAGVAIIPAAKRATQAAHRARLDARCGLGAASAAKPTLPPAAMHHSPQSKRETRHGLAVPARQQGRDHHRLEPRHRPRDRRALRLARRQGGDVEPQGRRLRGSRGRHQAKRRRRDRHPVQHLAQERGRGAGRRHGEAIWRRSTSWSATPR